MAIETLNDGYETNDPIRRDSVGISYSAPESARMARVPDSLAIALWIVGSCWALAIVAYAFGASTEWIFPLFIFGTLTGIAEWVLRQNAK